MTGILLLMLSCVLNSPAGEAPQREGATLYVSKLGDNSDGSSWAKAYTTVQAALQAVPDGRGGYRVIVRPDTYMEANLWPSHPGAAGAYNELVGDFDDVMDALRKELGATFEQLPKAVFVMKMFNNPGQP